MGGASRFRLTAERHESAETPPYSYQDVPEKYATLFRLLSNVCKDTAVDIEDMSVYGIGS